MLRRPGPPRGVAADFASLIGLNCGGPALLLTMRGQGLMLRGFVCAAMHARTSLGPGGFNPPGAVLLALCSRARRWRIMADSGSDRRTPDPQRESTDVRLDPSLPGSAVELASILVGEEGEPARPPRVYACSVSLPARTRIR